MNTTYVVAVGVADVRHDPDPASELVTQALMNTPAIASAFEGDWAHVTLPDYTGWIHINELEDPIPKSYCQLEDHCCTPIQLTAVVTATHAPLYTSLQSEEVLGEVYLSTALPLTDLSQQQRLQVALPGGTHAWLLRSAISTQQPDEPYPRQPVSAITAHARSFLGRPYLWGGTSWQGLDCSGFVQLCYRMGGYVIPRDADQQYAFLSHSIARDEIEEGDLIFFGRQQITHVAFALNRYEYIHAEGQLYNCVTINSFNPADKYYDSRLDAIVWGVKRVIS